MDPPKEVNGSFLSETYETKEVQGKYTRLFKTFYKSFKIKVVG